MKKSIHVVSKLQGRGWDPRLTGQSTGHQSTGHICCASCPNPRQWEGSSPVVGEKQSLGIDFVACLSLRCTCVQLQKSDCGRRCDPRAVPPAPIRGWSLSMLRLGEALGSRRKRAGTLQREQPSTALYLPLCTVHASAQLGLRRAQGNPPA